MPRALTGRILLSRMVRDRLDGTVVQNRKQDRAAEEQRQSPSSEEAAAPEKPQSSEKVKAESQEPPERQLNFLLWDKPNPDSWSAVSTLNQPSGLLLLLLYLIFFNAGQKPGG